MTLQQAIIWGRQQLSQSEDAGADVSALLCFVLDKEKAYLLTWPERELTQAQQQQYKDCIAERQKGRPVAYITGRREFWSLMLEVNDSTLIPRPDTETLVEVALSLKLPDNARVLDLGTGTGAVALALKSERPGWQVVACDHNEEAVALARRNSLALGLEVDVLFSNWLQSVPKSPKFDLILSNPPYIEAADPHLATGDVRFEPHTALIAENNGLADIETIIKQAKSHLVDQGWLLLEQGWQQADRVIDLLFKTGYKKVNRWQDYARVERVTGGKKASAERD
ncbi:peptide chain release factor N(5)-glutamine methyltransferase [Idiomarina sp. HP20-50]|uniref:peptide chain release factor N(5)-glutamine methyltransferase n=1 Tax=Idiomarina sp. HP20-50 TaxID=3070813 RepID=UPI00294AC2FA|nr:peptide chain release factor N(5)-glutamine methyltransferase [Idiomarina sp. HP20-50]MDV6315457.1 peptide chain release factor N(5)-glutamine methyltransferase [Idiomarina sp. HP20-50]